MFFFFNDTATTEIYTLSLHDTLPISRDAQGGKRVRCARAKGAHHAEGGQPVGGRSEEHTSELQSRLHLVCRLLLEKKKRHSGDKTQFVRTDVASSPHVQTMWSAASEK